MKTLMIIPAYNEAENIVRVVEELRRVRPDADFVVVNDGSGDDTRLLCTQHGYPVLDLSTNLGLAGAFQTGMRYAYEEGYDAALQLDGDGQHDPAFIAVMESTMEKEEADIVIGSRFVTKKRPHTLRMIGNRIISWAIRVTSGYHLTDPTSGMRLYGRRIMRYMAYEINASPEPNTITHMLRSGARMTEVQVDMRERTAGESYLSLGRSAFYMIHIVMDIFFVQRFRKRSHVVCPSC